MTEKSKVVLVIVGGCLLLLGWWLSDLPIGYYQFKRICESEGGLRVYEKVEPNVGWIASNEPDARGIVSSYSTVPFARFRSDDGTWKDVKYKGGNPWWSSSYEISLADESKKPRYRMAVKVESVADAIRLTKYVRTLTDESSSQPVFIYTRFTFTWTNPEHTLLGRSDSAYCLTGIDEAESIRTMLHAKE